MPTYKWLIFAVGDNGRYEKAMDLPFAPQVGMTIFRESGEGMWGGGIADLYHTSPPITKVGYNLDEERFEVEILINRDIELNSAFWGDFFPL